MPDGSPADRGAVSAGPTTDHLEDLRGAIMDAFANVSADSAAVVTKNADELAVVFLDSAEAYIVTIQPAGLVVLDA